VKDLNFEIEQFIAIQKRMGLIFLPENFIKTQHYFRKNLFSFCWETKAGE
jgi:hypothetical protein